MKRFSIVAIFLFAVYMSGAQSLTGRLDALLDDDFLHDADASVAVYDLSLDTIVYAHREHKRCRPASVAKLATVAAALDKLGSSYTLDTHLYNHRHNLYVKGSMDPLFGEEDMDSMVKSVPVGAVVDTLFADCSFCDSLYWGPGWAWDDNPYGFQPYISPLLLCGGTIEVVVKPAAKGNPPHYKCTPESSFYNVKNEAECGNGQLGKLTILRDWLDNSNTVRIRGNCTRVTKERINMYKSADFFAAVLAERLQDAGVTVKNISFGATPDSAKCLHLAKRPIKAVVDEALMESDNICAEALLYHLATTTGKRSYLSMKDGCRVVSAFFADSLRCNGGYSLYDGSGLSPYNSISADAMAKLLRYIYKSNFGHVVYDRLPLSGVSGTMKHRTKGTAAYKKIRAKTGTVTGVCTLAGYATASNGHILAFVIMNCGMESAREARAWQDKVCDVLCR